MTIDLAGYDLAHHKAASVCRHVMDGYPVLAFLHEDDGDIQFSCGASEHSLDDWLVMGVEHVVDRHPDLRSLPTVRMGEIAERDAAASPWVVVPT